MSDKPKIGFVCGICETFNEKEEHLCTRCGNKLDIRSFPINNKEEAISELNYEEYLNDDETQQEEIKEKTVDYKIIINNKEETNMEQARYKICKNCFNPVPSGHQFCGKCGAQIDYVNKQVDTDYYGEILIPGTALLIFIKGIEYVGSSFHLSSNEHIIGRGHGVIPLQDSWISPRHANFYYKDNKLFLKDEGSLNGIYYKINAPQKLQWNDMIMAGSQIFTILPPERVQVDPNPDGTYFLGSPSQPSPYKVVHMLEGGRDGVIVNPKENVLVIGREGCDLNFSDDGYLSLRHLQIEATADGVILTDLGSKNGTFVRIKNEKQVKHGDYVFIGRELIRVETNIPE